MASKMARKKRNNPKHEETIDVVESEESVVENEPLEDQQAEKRKKDQFFKWPLLIIFSLGFLLYVQTVTYDYALDDKLVITHNYITKKGFKGIDDHFSTDFLVGFFGKQKNLLAGGRYRPLSLVSFAIENQLFGKKKMNSRGQFVVDKEGDQIYEYNPFVGHLFNAIFYALIGMMLFLIMHKLFPPDQSKAWYLSFPFIVALIYVVHPLHTEAVANIKGRDELMSLYGSLAALFFSLKYLDKKEVKHLVFSGVCFFLAIMSKESTVTFVAVVPMTIYFFTKSKIKDNIIAVSPLVLMTAVYIIIRLQILGGARTEPVPELMNNPFMHAASDADKYATIFYTLGLYIKLLFIPHPLTHDYYPWHPIGEYIANTGNPYPYLHWGDIGAFGSLIIYLGLIYFGLKGLKSKSIVSYCILFYLGTLFLVSNLVFPVGTFLNERFMFVPSIGFAMLIAHFLVNWLPQKIKSPETYQKVVTTFLAVVVIAFSAKTITRNMSWENDFTLSVGDVKVSGNSAKSNMSAGLALVDESKKYKESDPQKQKQMLNQAIKHLNKSLNIYTTYIQPMLIVGNAHYELEDYDKAIYYFEQCLQLNNTYEYATKNLEHVGDLCTTKKLYKVAAKSYETLMNYDKTNAGRVYMKLGELYGKNMNDMNSAQKYLEMSLQITPESSEVLQKLGVVYAMTGKPAKAIDIFEKALIQNPENAHILMNIGIAYKNLGQPEKGQQYLDKAFEIDPKLKGK